MKGVVGSGFSAVSPVDFHQLESAEVAAAMEAGSTTSLIESVPEGVKEGVPPATFSSVPPVGAKVATAPAAVERDPVEECGNFTSIFGEIEALGLTPTTKGVDTLLLEGLGQGTCNPSRPHPRFPPPQAVAPVLASAMPQDLTICLATISNPSAVAMPSEADTEQLSSEPTGALPYEAGQQPSSLPPCAVILGASFSGAPEPCAVGASQAQDEETICPGCTKERRGKLKHHEGVCVSERNNRKGVGSRILGTENGTWACRQRG